jgi:type I restriction enzyme S subunit
MASNRWREMTLGEFVRLQRGHDLPETDRRPGMVPIMGSAGQNGFHDTAKAKGPGVVIGRSGVGSMGVVTYCATDYWPHNTVLYVTDFLGNDARFAYYFLHNLNLRRFDSGSAQASLNRNYIYPIRIRVPDRTEQRAISHILGTLDDKIELNRRMNETLAAIARALFKSWFVDFDPVRAKAEGRDPDLPKHLADLFPDSFEDSEVGEIPKGWRVAPIGELANVVGGSTPSTKEAAFWSDGQHYWTTPKDLSNLATPVLLETERKITDAGLAQIGSGLLPPGTVLLSSRAPIGYLAISEVPVAINQGFIAMLPTKGVSNLFLLYWAGWAHEEIVSRANGSTFLEISKASFRPIPVVAPPGPIFGAFEQMVRPLYARIVSNERESRTLASIRDALLPKLISGELRVKDAEQIVEAAL